MGIVFKMYVNEHDGKFPPVEGDGPFEPYIAAPLDFPYDGSNMVMPPGCTGARLVQLIGDWGVSAGAIYPEYLTDMKVLLCPSSLQNTGNPDSDLARLEDDGSGLCPPHLRGYYAEIDLCYQYLGFVIDRGDDLPGYTYPDTPDEYGFIYNSQLADLVWGAFAAAGLWDATPDNVDNDLPISGDYGNNVGTGGGDVHYRLKEGIERFLITNINNPAGSSVAQSELPVMWDYVAAQQSQFSWKPETQGKMFNHVPGGSNVLYMDGHVEFQRYPGKFPASRGTAGVLAW
jgi:prepilin-type processing-associated H-X9-DG protein